MMRCYIYTLWTFLTPWRNFIGLLVTHPDKNTIHFRETAHQSPRTWHETWSHLARKSFSCFRVGSIKSSPYSEGDKIKFPFKMRPPPPLSLSLQRIHPEARIWGKGKYKDFTLYNDGGLGKGDAKPKDTMLRANKGDSLRTGRGLSSVWNILSLSGILSMLNSRTSVSAGDSLVHVSV